MWQAQCSPGIINYEDTALIPLIRRLSRVTKRDKPSVLSRLSATSASFHHPSNHLHTLLTINHLRYTKRSRKEHHFRVRIPLGFQWSRAFRAEGQNFRTLRDDAQHLVMDLKPPFIERRPAGNFVASAPREIVTRVTFKRQKNDLQRYTSALLSRFGRILSIIL